MKFSAREDIAAPMDEVFAAISDVAFIERQALRRGFDVARLDGSGPPGVGSRWEVGFSYRSLKRNAVTEISRWDAGERIELVTSGEGMRGLGEIDLTRLAKARTRLHVTLDLKPETFRSRLLIQSLRLAKSGLTRRFKDRVAALARQIEAGRAS